MELHNDDRHNSEVNVRAWIRDSNRAWPVRHDHRHGIIVRGMLCTEWQMHRSWQRSFGDFFDEDVRR